MTKSKKNKTRNYEYSHAFVSLPETYQKSLKSAIMDMVVKTNTTLQSERQVTPYAAVIVASRSLRETSSSINPGSRVFAALRAVNSFINLARTGKPGVERLANTDLLPVAHPLSTRSHVMGEMSLRGARAQWFASDPRIDDDVRALIATAYSQTPGTVEHRHAFTRISALPSGAIPQEIRVDAGVQLTPIIAVLGLGGNSEAARRLRAQLQRRDRKGRFAEMGGGFSINLRMPDGMFKVASGRVVGASGSGDNIEIEITGNSDLPDGIYNMPSTKGEAAKAILSPEAVEDLPGAKEIGTTDAVDISTLVRQDAPSGWTKVDTPEGQPQLWTSEDGYFAQKDGDTLSLHRADLKTEKMGPAIAEGKSWADVQKAALADQDDYAKAIEGAKATIPVKPSAGELPAIEDRSFRKGDVPVGYLKKGDLIPKYFPTQAGEAQLKKNRAENPDFEMKPVDEVIGLATFKGQKKGKITLKVRDIASGEERSFEVNENAVIYDTQIYEPGKPKAEVPAAPKAEAPTDLDEARAKYAVVNRGEGAANWVDAAPEDFKEKLYDSIIDSAVDSEIDLAEVPGLDDAWGDVSTDDFLKAVLNDTFTEGAGTPFYITDAWDKASAPEQTGEAPSTPVTKLEQAQKILDDMRDSGDLTDEQIDDRIDSAIALVEEASSDFNSFLESVDAVGEGNAENSLDNLIEELEDFKTRFDEAAPDFDDVISDIEIDIARFSQTDTEPVEPNNAVDQSMFDSTFITPDDSYKLNVFDVYNPQGRTDQDSPDYSDDPYALANRFTAENLQKALREALLPSEDGDPATGIGYLPFDNGDEGVPAEAIYEALGFSGIDSDMVVAGIYDSMLPEGSETNIDRLNAQRDELDNIGGESFDPSDIETARDWEIRQAIKRNNQLAAPMPAAPAVAQLQDVVKNGEQNPKINALSDLLIESQNDPELDEFSANRFEQILNDQLDLAFSEDPADVEAFRAFWGTMMSIDGGAINDAVDPQKAGSFRRSMILLLTERNGEDENAAIAQYDDFISKYGGYPEWVDGKEAISEGLTDVFSDDSAAGPFFRLVATSAKPNDVRLHRHITVLKDDPLLERYTTVGSVFPIDPRSFTTNDLSVEDPIGAIMYGPNITSTHVVFELMPGSGDSISLGALSWYEAEKEHLAWGQYEVTATRRAEYGGRMDLTVVTLKKVDAVSSEENRGAVDSDIFGPGDDAAVDAVSKPDVSDWAKVGPQMGSNSGGTYEAPNGDTYYVKQSKSLKHAENEALASALYKELGVNAVDVQVGEANGEPRTVSPIVPNTGETLADRLGDGDFLDKIREDFAIDAWLGNYDVAGLVYDNIIVDNDGNPLRVDPGGALIFRARGAEKGDMFGDSVGELDTLVDPNINPASSRVFGGMSDEQKRASAEKLLNITPERIDQIIDSIVTDPGMANGLKDRLKKRRADILDRYGIEDSVLNMPEVAERPVAPADKSPESIDAFKDELAKFAMDKAIAKGWNCGDGLTSAAIDPCDLPSVNELIAEATPTAEELATPTPKALPSDEEVSNAFDALDDDVETYTATDWGLEAGDKVKYKKARTKVQDIRERYEAGEISREEAASELAALRDEIAAGSGEPIAQEGMVDSIDAIIKNLDGTIYDPVVVVDKNLPPPGSGLGLSKDKVTVIKPGMTVKSKDGVTYVVKRYDPANWNYVYLTPVDGGKEKIKSTKTLEILGGEEGGGGGGGTPEAPEPGGDLPKAEAPQGAPEAPEVPETSSSEARAADVGDEVANPSSEQNQLANRVPPKEVLLELIRSGSTNKDTRLNESWATYLSEYDGSAKGAEHFANIANLFEEFGANLLTLRNEDAVKKMLDMKILRVKDENATDPIEKYDVEPALATLIHGILSFTSGTYATYDDPETAKEQVERMRSFPAPLGLATTYAYPSAAASYKIPSHETLADFWETFAMVLEDPKLLDTDIDVATSPAGILMRTLRDAGEMKGSYTRILSFEQPIQDPSHPLNYLLEPDAYITIRPSSWSYDSNPDDDSESYKGLNDRELFHYGSFGERKENKGDVMITVEDPKGLNARPIINAYNEAEVILSNGRYRVSKVEKKRLTDTGTEYTHIRLVKDSTETEQVKPQESSTLVKDVPIAVLRYLSTNKREEYEKELDSLLKADSEYTATKAIVDRFASDLTTDIWKGEENTERVSRILYAIRTLQKHVKNGESFYSKKGDYDGEMRMADLDDTLDYAVNTLKSRSKKFTDMYLGDKNPNGVIGPGIEPVIIEDALPYTESAITSTPSVADAFALVASDAPNAGLTGTYVAIDSTDIEDVSVRVQRFNDEHIGGRPVTRLRYKLTSWAGQNLTDKIESGNTEYSGKKGLRVENIVQKTKGSTGLRTISETDYVFERSYGGKTYTLRLDNGIKINFRRGGDNVEDPEQEFHEQPGNYSSVNSLNNLVTIDIPDGLSFDEVQSALKEAGVTDPRPATEQDYRGLIENRLISTLGGRTNAARNIADPATRQKILDGIKKNLDISPDDVYVDIGANGRIELRISDEKAKKLAEKAGIDTAQHAVNINSSSEQVPILSSILTGPHQALMSTLSRWTEGLAYGGMSSNTDMLTGGADYVFLTPKSTADSKSKSPLQSGASGSSSYFVFDAAKLFTRLDFYANYTDKYGGRDPNNDNLANATDGGYELMFKDRIPMDFVKNLVVSPEAREKLLEKLREDGVTSIGEVPIEEFISIGGQPVAYPEGSTIKKYADGVIKNIEIATGKPFNFDDLQDYDAWAEETSKTFTGTGVYSLAKATVPGAKIVAIFNPSKKDDKNPFDPDSSAAYVMMPNGTFMIHYGYGNFDAAGQTSMANAANSYGQKYMLYLGEFGKELQDAAPDDF